MFQIKHFVGKITVASYQMEDMVNMLIKNGYVVEVENYIENRVHISIYEYCKRENKGKED